MPIKSDTPNIFIFFFIFFVFISLYEHFFSYVFFHWCWFRVAAVKRHHVLHYSVIYICWSLLIIEPIRGILKIYMRVSDET